MQNANHVELAMEWLFANPEAAAADAEAAGGAGGAAAGASQAAADDEALAAMVADALTVDGHRMGMLRERVSWRTACAAGHC
jgi:hypothetical protein